MTGATLVIDPNPVQLRSLVQRLEGQGACVSREAADEALAERSKAYLGCWVPALEVGTQWQAVSLGGPS